MMKRIGTLVTVGLDDMLGLSLAAFYDMLAEKAGYPLMEDIEYKVIGVKPDDSLVLFVRGDVWSDETTYAEAVRLICEGLQRKALQMGVPNLTLSLEGDGSAFITAWGTTVSDWDKELKHFGMVGEKGSLAEWLEEE